MINELDLNEIKVIAGTVEHVPLRDETVEVELVEDEEASFGTIIVTYQGNETLLENFADGCEIIGSPEHPVYNVSVPYWESRDANVALFLIGTWRVVAMSDTGECKDVYQLNRRRDQDGSFWREFRVDELPDSYIVLGESGIARVSDNGQCMWHTKLFWDDFFLHADESGYWFENEHVNDEKPFLVSLADGKCPFREALL